METPDSNLLINDIKVYALKKDFKDNIELEDYINDNRVNKYMILELENNKIGLEVSLFKEDIQKDLDLIEPDNMKEDIFNIVSTAITAMIEEIKDDSKDDSKDEIVNDYAN